MEMESESPLARWLARSSPYVALLAAWIAMSGSLYFSEVAGFIPCTLCWYQRILMYPLALIIAVGILLPDSRLPYFVLPLSILGQGVSTYHYLLQKTQLFGGHTVCQAGVPCTTMWINWFGFVTIPFLALVAFSIITIAALVAYYGDEPAEPEEDEPYRRPWLPVTGIVVLVVGAFLVLAQTQGQEATATPPEPTALPVIQMPPGAPTPAAMAVASSDGAQLYSQACQACHGPDGQGVAGLGPALVSSELVQDGDGEHFVTFVRQGGHVEEEEGAADPAAGPPMPPCGGHPELTDQDLLAIRAFLKAE